MLKLLKSSFIVDGTGQKGFKGDLLIENSKIKAISDTGIHVGDDVDVVDCEGLVVAPGFIDVHSHYDYLIWLNNSETLTRPFTCQGVTTFVGGHCGYSPGGFKKNTQYLDILKKEGDTMYRPKEDYDWVTMAEYFGYIEKKGLPNNLAMFVGHGSVRTSMKGSAQAPMNPDEMKEFLNLFEAAMDQGAAGVSLGLMYAPGICSPIEELEAIAGLVKRKNKVYSVHMKAYTITSGCYNQDPLEKPHNLTALQEMLDIGRKTGVKLLISHLIFPGPGTWPTAPRALELIDQAIADGVDVKFDIIGNPTSMTYMTSIFPEWFMADMPDSLYDKTQLENLAAALENFFQITGYTPKYYQIQDTASPELKKYIGKFYHDVAIERGLSQTDNIIDIVRQEIENGGVAPGIIRHNNTTEEIIEMLMKHTACLCASDSNIFTGNLQLRQTYGNFPLYLSRSRDNNLLPLEEIVHKITGASAETAGLKNRGFLHEGFPADITVFDWKNIKDNTTNENTTAPPSGLEQVFINGEHVLKNGRYIGSSQAGKVIKVIN